MVQCCAAQSKCLCVQPETVTWEVTGVMVWKMDLLLFGAWIRMSDKTSTAMKLKAQNTDVF